MGRHYFSLCCCSLFVSWYSLLFLKLYCLIVRLIILQWGWLGSKNNIQQEVPMPVGCTKCSNWGCYHSNPLTTVQMILSHYQFNGTQAPNQWCMIHVNSWALDELCQSNELFNSHPPHTLITLQHEKTEFGHIHNPLHVFNCIRAIKESWMPKQSWV